MCYFFIDEKEEGDESPNSNSSGGDSCRGKPSSNPGKSPAQSMEDVTEEKPELPEVKEEDVKVPLHAQCTQPVSILICYNLAPASKPTHFVPKEFV